MTSVRVGENGEIPLPGEVRSHYGLEPDRQVRIVETRSGILLVPLTGSPMSEELERELDEWQALGRDAMTHVVYHAEEP
jgi:bifunctional DNA-binding transcriptional regulator/antitoxin component of YhaV-PrlF toxin-antitoxin module